MRPRLFMTSLCAYQISFTFRSTNESSPKEVQLFQTEKLGMINFIKPLDWNENWIHMKIIDSFIWPSERTMYDHRRTNEPTRWCLPVIYLFLYATSDMKIFIIIAGINQPLLLGCCWNSVSAPWKRNMREV